MKKTFYYIIILAVVALVGLFMEAPEAHATNAAGTFDMSNYRWRNDDGSETTATWIQAANTEITNVSLTAQLRIRTSITEGGTCQGTGCRMQQRLEFSSDATSCTTGSWTTVTTSTSGWRLRDSSNFTNGAATTQQLTSGTFAAGKMLDTANPAGTNTTMSQSGKTEDEWSIDGNSPSNGTVYYFRTTNVGTVLNSYSNCGKLTTVAAATTFTQTTYRWYVDNDLADPTAVWGTPDLTENQAITILPPGKDPPSNAQELRLRVNITVNTANLAVSSQQFKLKFKAGTDGSCTTGSWTDVGAVAASAWQFASSTVTDGADLATNGVLSTTTAGKGEEYAKTNPTQTNHVAANTAEVIEYDFHIIGSGSDFATATQYSFRVTESDETVFDAYTNCPTLTTEPGTDNLLRHGNVFDSGVERGFFWAD